MQKSIMVTGGAGYIGSHTALNFISQGFEVIIVDNLSTGNKKLIPPHAIFYETDIAKTATIADIIQKHNIEAIIHFAGSIIVPESVTNPLKYYYNNTVKSQSLINNAIKNNVKQFIFSSTAAVYGMPNKELITENTHLSPINPYGTSKLMTENMLQDVHKAHNMDIGILRYFNVAGADHQGRSGQAMQNATHLIKVACEVMTGKRQHIEIFGTDYDTKDGTCIRDYIHVSDLAEAHSVVLKKLMTDGGQIITNCGYGSGYSVRDVLDCAEKVLGQPFTKIASTRRAGDPPALVSDNHYLTHTLGWQPQYNDLFQIIQTAFNWEKNLL